MIALSAAQERLWFLHQLDPGDASYNLPMAMRIRGPLDVVSLVRALDTVVDRHEVLRSRIEQHDGAPRSIASTEPIGWERVDCADLEAGRRVLAASAGMPFDLAAGPLIRPTLVRLTDEDHLLSVVTHHIASDGWSIQLLRRELAALYEAYTDGRPSPLPPPPLQYSQHVARQGPDDPAALAYWTTRLAGAPALDLPTDRPRGAVRSGRGDSIVFDIPFALLADLDRFARAERATLFMVLMAAYQVLLCRHSGQADVTVGVPVFGRDDPDVESVIGYFSETLVFRGDQSGDPAFRDFLRATRASVLGGFAHRSVPFERILTAMAVPRDRSRTPLFQAMFMFLRQDADRPVLGDLDVELFDHAFAHAKTDIALDIIQGPAAATGVLTFDSDLFDRSTMERFIRRLLVLLGDIPSRPAARLSELRILDGEEHDEVRSRWNDTAIAAPPGLAPDLFAAQARRTPDAIALTFDGRDTTYADLDAQVDRVAVRLAGRGPLVGVCLARGPEMIAALLGAWRAGAAYLPLDPEYPADRIALIVEDSGADIVLTSADLADRFGARALVIDDAEDAGPVSTRTGEEAYVLYTSGSTGRPKGVVVPHRALAAFLHAMAEICGPQDGRTWLALTSLSFDISGLELYLPLTRGGRVVIVPDEATRDGVALRHLIERHNVTDVQATPSGWRLLLEAGFADPAVSALVGGEALPPQLAADLRARVGRLVNVYGPTETTIWSSWWEVPPAPESVSIGGPIAGTRLHILDEHLRLVPLGVAGELCIAGDGVALGYHRRPALTAEKFQPDPYGPAGTRLYRTGDRARRRTDGRIEFLGRVDNQVKLRGHRIELGEIEAVIDRVPAVHAAAVVVRDEALIAFVTLGLPQTGSDRAGAVDAILAAARAALPAYMVPAAVVVLDDLPLTPNGKIDRRALPDASRPAAAAFTAPRDAAEARVAEVFAEVLGVERAGAHDDFFALGGHSLLAAKVIARLGAIPVRELFDHPTVAGFAARLPAGLVRVPLARRPDGAAAPLSRAQERLWFLQRLDPGDASYNMFTVLRLRGPLDIDALTRAWNQLAERHETLRTRYPDRDGEPSTDLAPRAVPIEHQPATGGLEEARRLVAERTNTPFDLAAGPPVRLTLIRLADDDHVLCLVVHHIAGDGWSLNILRDDLAALYRGTRPADLAPMPLQFGDIAYHQRQSGPEPIDYWRDQLADPTVLELPADRPRPAIAAHRGAFHGFRLGTDVTGDLEALAAACRTTLFTVLLAAYQVFLSRHSGQNDVSIGSTFAGRDRIEFESVVGYFANTLVLRGEVAAGATFADLVAATRQTVLDAMAHEDVPFEDLLSALHVTRDRSITPLFQTMFILHSQDETESDGRFADLDFEFFDSGYQQAKFDLMLEAWRDPDGLSLVLGYDADLFDHETIQRWGDRFATLATAVARTPSLTASAAPMLTTADEHRLVELQAAPPAPATAPVPDLIRSATRTHPGAVAVRSGTGSLTYAELDERVGALAARMRMHGVVRESIVAVRLDRSLDAIVALLAVWRAGGAYLPIDPELPPERIRLVLDDSDATLVVATAPIDTDRPVLRIDQPARVDGTLPFGSTDPRTAAYVIYTSGSTGRPKGVVIEHHALAARVGWMRDHYAVQPSDHVVQFASLSFDAHAEEIYPALAAGATVEMLPGGALSLPELLRVTDAVTILDLPTAYWHHLVDQIDQIAWPAGLRLVILGGEQVHAGAVARWRDRFGDAIRLVNSYGPTEAAIIATTADLTATDPAGRPPIGRPLAGTRAVVVDELLRPVPPGAGGELLLGGAGLARGYLNRPDLTAQRFIEWDGERFYRTGDRTRWRADGQLEFLGRIDEQVKVRGFRVEPGEIEAQLVAHPLVAQAAVIAHEGTLVAYVVSTAGPDELRRHLTALLPKYMVPDIWMPLSEMPLTASGKVDRRALPAPHRTTTSAYVAPRTEAEARVAAVFADVLGLGEVGAFDDFFALGGHSLLAVKAVARLGGIPVRDLFDHPVVADFAELCADGPAPAVVPPRPAGTPPPLSPAQERLWFLQRLDPADASYNMVNVMRLRGRLDGPAFEAAVGDLLARHETLRVRYPEVDGAPVARVETTPARIDRIDVTGGEGPARALVAARTNAPFDLTAAPPLRITLIRLADDDHILCLVLHHIAGDGWSFTVLREELGELYAAHRDNRATTLAPVPLQFGDVVFHQLGDKAHDDTSREYWREQLADPTVLELPTDFTRPAVAARRGAFHGFRVPADVVAGLDRLAAEARTTVFAVLLAAWQVFLAKHTGQSDILVGSVFAGRDRVEFERLVGYFTTTLVLRGDMSDDPTFTDFVGSTRDTVLAALTHQRIPFEDLLADLRVTRETSRTPVFQTMFILHSQNPAQAASNLADLDLEFFDSGYRQAKVDLQLEAWPDETGLTLVLGYDTDLFGPDTIERWGERLALLCAAAVRDPRSPISALPVLTPADTAALAAVEIAADTHPLAGTSELVPDWIARVTAARPDAVAVSCGTESISYRELAERAGSLAAHLRQRGVAHESVVAVCLPRSIEVVVTLLAIWRAGAAYLPLEPDLPADRLRWVLADSAAALAVTSSKVDADWPIGTVVLDQLTLEDDASIETVPTTPATAAYVMYTSGSTGRPKGVIIEHHALAARIAWMQHEYALTFGERIVQFASLTFDPSAEEIFTALSTGATIELLPDGPLSLPEVLRTPNGQDVTFLDIPTAYWHQLCEQIDEIGWPRRLRQLILGGEQVHATAVAKWRARFGDSVRLLNTYGPTEATIMATSADMGPDDAIGRPTIGVPIAGTRVAVVDRHLRKVAPGVTGELLLGGAGLARGYLGNPELTAEKFIAFDGGRFYRTGDRVRWRPDGNLEFVGRVDDQVKVRGFRVEPGEVEAHLVRHPGVAAAVVVAHEGMLVAYIVGDAGHDELRQHLGAALPNYMVPDLWSTLDRFPTNAAGKIDRRALVPPSPSDAAEQAHVAPRTDAEELVADVWREVLGVERISAFDDFFELGGHSLLAVRVGARLKATADIDIPIRTLFTNRTVADLAAAIDALLADELAELSDEDIARLLEKESR